MTSLAVGFEYYWPRALRIVVLHLVDPDAHRIIAAWHRNARRILFNTSQHYDEGAKDSDKRNHNPLLCCRLLPIHQAARP
jgi:hypothetical protein